MVSPIFSVTHSPPCGAAMSAVLMRHVVVENAGHTFRPTAAQRALARLLDDFVAAPVATASAGERSS